MEERPFQILGVEQIAVGALDKEPLHHLWMDLLGLVPAGDFRNDVENVIGEIALVGPRCFAGCVNLLQPIDPERSPRVHRPSLNHVGFWVDDLAAAVSWLTARGIRFTPRGIRRGAGGNDVCFIDPREGGEGVLVELVQAPPDVIAALRSESEGT
jgi:lactoylglutathione lyase